MKYAKLGLVIAGIVALLSIGYFFYTLSVVASQLPKVAQDTIHTEAVETRSMVDALVRKTEQDLSGQITALRTSTFREIGNVRTDANTQLDATRNQLLAEVHTQLDKTNASVAELVKIRSDFTPTINAVNQLSPSILRNSLGTIAAVKVAAGSTAQMMDKVNDATPKMLASIQQVAENSDQTTAATAETMRNISEAVKPLPRWVRVPLQIAVPASQLALPFVLK